MVFPISLIKQNQVVIINIWEKHKNLLSHSFFFSWGHCVLSHLQMKCKYMKKVKLVFPKRTISETGHIAYKLVFKWTYLRNCDMIKYTNVYSVEVQIKLFSRWLNVWMNEQTDFKFYLSWNKCRIWPQFFFNFLNCSDPLGKNFKLPQFQNLWVLFLNISAFSKRGYETTYAMQQNTYV